MRKGFYEEKKTWKNPYHTCSVTEKENPRTLTHQSRKRNETKKSIERYDIPALEE